MRVTSAAEPAIAIAAGRCWSSTPAISGDGRFVVFFSTATNLVPSDTNHRADIFVADRTANTIERVNVSSGGAQANDDSYYLALSADGAMRWSDDGETPVGSVSEEHRASATAALLTRALRELRQQRPPKPQVAG